MTKALFRPILRIVGGTANLELVIVVDDTSYGPTPLDPGGIYSVHGRANGTVCLSMDTHPPLPINAQSSINNGKTLTGLLVWYWGVGRGLIAFDTALAPNPASISSAQIRIPLRDWAQAHPPDATLHLVEGVQHIPAIPSDYGAELGATTDLATPIPVAPDGIQFFVLNALGISKINPGSQTKYCTRVEGDINANSYLVAGGDGVRPTGLYADGRDYLTPLPTSTASAVGHHGATLNLNAFQGLGLPQLEVDFVGAPLPFPRLYFTYWNGDDPGTLFHTPYHLGLGMGDTPSDVISGLLPGKNYSFRADIDLDGSTTVQGTVNGFTTLYDPPTGVTRPASAITAYTATLNGEITDLKDSAFANVWFIWGPSPGPFPYTAAGIPAHLVAPGVFAATLSGLTSNTAYHYDIVWQDDSGVSNNNGVVNFSTLQIPRKINKAYALGRHEL